MKLIMVPRAIEREDIGRKVFIPLYDNGQDRINKMKGDEAYVVEIRKDRNPKFHRKFMAILRLVLANCPTDNDGRAKWTTVDQLLNALKISLGYYDLEVDMKGRRFPAPRSINFETMDDTEFDEKIYKPGLILLAEILKTSAEELDDQDNWVQYAE